MTHNPRLKCDAVQWWNQQAQRLASSSAPHLKGQSNNRQSTGNWMMFTPIVIILTHLLLHPLAHRSTKKNKLCTKRFRNGTKQGCKQVTITSSYPDSIIQGCAQWPGLQLFGLWLDLIQPRFGCASSTKVIFTKKEEWNRQEKMVDNFFL